MRKPAVRIGDWHICPMVTGAVPHIGGPVLPPGAPTVLIDGKPAACVGDRAVCTNGADSIITGSSTVLIEGRGAARMGDVTLHGGSVTTGCFTVLIGD